MKNIFIHGWSFSKDIWKDFFHLENSHFLDLPFHGENRVYTHQNIIEKFSDEVSSLINSSREKVNIIGWSLGASISVKAILKANQNNINRLILIGFTPKFKDKNLGHNPALIKAFFVALNIDFRDTVYNFRKVAVGDKFENISLPEKEGSKKLLKEFVELDLRDNIQNIKVKTLLIHGTEDKIISQNGSKFANEKIKNSKILLVKSHHAPFLTDSNLILQFLQTSS